MSNLLNFYYEATQKITNSLEIDVSLKECLDYLTQYIPCEGIYINVFIQEHKEIRFLAKADSCGHKKSKSRIQLTEDMCLELLRKDRPQLQIVNDFRNHKLADYVLSQSIPSAKSLILIKLNKDGKHLGVVGVYSKKTDAFNSRHGDLLLSLSQPFCMVTALELQRLNLLAQQAELQQQKNSLRKSIDNRADVIGGHTGLCQVMTQVEAISPLDCTVLINGETGSGKEVIAAAIHNRSVRKNKSFVKVNCGAIPDSLIDSELFGYEKGAFTGAESIKRGYFEKANGGTIFLDEIGELPLSAQVRLLRVLQSHSITRVGGTEEINLDIRIISATHRDLQEMVLKGEFREDLWYRLNVVPILIPALRNRRQDIPLLAQNFIEECVDRFCLSCLPQICTEQMPKLTLYDWPGNVRELRNVIERAVIESQGQPLSFDFLNVPALMKSEEIGEGEIVVIDVTKAGNKIVPMDIMIKKYIEHALRISGGVIHGKNGAAKLLDMNSNTLRSRMKKLGLL